jgi:CRP-like cAMP-binding protein
LTIIESVNKSTRGREAMPAIATHSHHVAGTRFPPELLAGATGAAEDMAAFDRIATVVPLCRDQTLFFEGDPAQHCFKVVGGILRSCKLLPDGRRHVSQFLLPGDFAGFESDDTYRSTVEAVNDATVMRYPRRTIDQLVLRQPRLGKSLLGMFCEGLLAAHAQMLLLGRKNAVERLASFLLEMSERNGEDDRVELPMTRGDIADHLGLTTETVSRTFSQLKGRGVIQLKASSEVIIKRRSELEGIAEAA